jgi:DNA-binding XRE family transcriptional regulator
MLSAAYLAPKKFPEALKACREDARMTQADVARSCNVDTTTVGQWESGKNLPKFYNAQRLCEIFPLLHPQVPWDDIRALPQTEAEAQAKTIRALREQLKEMGVEPVA